MLRIGDFASQCNVTVKAVRLYEEKGILKPAYVDQYTGYRYYDGNNVERLMQIMFFKDLGFTLREIKDLSIESIMKKVDVLKKTISEIQTNIEKLEKLSLSSKGELRMKTFINDDRMIGKWENIGAIRDKAGLKTIQESHFPFKELYLLPNGEQYWVISWSKGFIRIKDTDHPYEIINNLMYLEVMDLNGEAEFIQVFKQVDHKPYTKQDIRFRDDIDFSFEQDEKVIGKWNAIDFVCKPNEFDPYKKSFDDLWLKNMTFNRNGSVIVNLLDGKSGYGMSWTKGMIVDKQDMTSSAYEIKIINDENYLFMEWKSGDYIYGHWQPSYYVFVREK